MRRFRSQLDQMARRIEYENSRFEKRIRFCPSCSTPNLEPHERTTDLFGKDIQGKEFWCRLCGYSFNIRRSVDWNYALQLFRDDRKMRVGKFLESDLDPMVAAEWKRVYEKPTAKHTWPARSGWNLGEKLKAALSL